MLRLSHFWIGMLDMSSHLVTISLYWFFLFSDNLRWKCSFRQLRMIHHALRRLITCTPFGTKIKIGNKNHERYYIYSNSSNSRKHQYHSKTYVVDCRTQRICNKISCFHLCSMTKQKYISGKSAKQSLQHCTGTWQNESLITFAPKSKIIDRPTYFA